MLKLLALLVRGQARIERAVHDLRRDQGRRIATLAKAVRDLRRVLAD